MTVSLQDQPAVVATYGVPGSGKSTDALYSFPRGLFVAAPGALKPAAFVVGYTPAMIQLHTIGDLIKLIKSLKLGQYDAIVIDDFSMICDHTLMTLEGKFTGWKLWGEIRSQLLEFREASRSCGMHVVLNAHESAPATKDGFFIRGGPRLPGKMPEDLSAACDIVLRSQKTDGIIGWPVTYRCTVQDASYISKDRHGVTPDFAPMNLAEILRMAQYKIQRAPGLEWQEGVAEGIANSLLGKAQDQVQPTIQNVLTYTRSKGYTDLHARWAIRDGLARWILRKANSNPMALYGV